jgi:hypothetical protein
MAPWRGGSRAVCPSAQAMSLMDATRVAPRTLATRLRHGRGKALLRYRRPSPIGSARNTGKTTGELRHPHHQTPVIPRDTLPWRRKSREAATCKTSGFSAQFPDARSSRQVSFGSQPQLAVNPSPPMPNSWGALSCNRAKSARLTSRLHRSARALLACPSLIKRLSSAAHGASRAPRPPSKAAGSGSSAAPSYER